MTSHDKHVQNAYGLEPGEYDRLLREQGGRCAICRWANGSSKRLAVDHDHKTGLVRGLLCGPCNQIMGYLKDEPEAWLRGYEYLMEARMRNEERLLTEGPPSARARDDEDYAPRNQGRRTQSTGFGRGWPAAVY